MTRLRCLSLCACLGLSLTTLACGSGGSGAAKPWDQGRIANTGTDWWVNVTKGVFFFSVKITNSYLADKAGAATVISFTEGLIDKITPGAALASLLPTSGEVQPWTYDQGSDYTKDGPATATNFADATTYVDGAADPIFGVDPITGSTRTYQPVALTWELYTNGSTTTLQRMDAKIAQMASPGDAGKLFNDILSFSQYTPAPVGTIVWTQCTGSDPNPCGTL
jgi:hypothetical protein